ncbi:MAG: hypothetical protein CME65_04560 [Halobacteriovoraceae bacterium]|nr:hypothetical protein [Halobacteriovoraceae bacterium]|tara:strand:+ start:9134 stop:9661 length:528 start_codon:yes stop_codon:yes gene_type:complete
MANDNLKLKTIGIVGGMGPLAGVEFHRRLIQKFSADADHEYPEIIHLSKSREVPDRTSFLLGEEDFNPGFAIKNQIKILKESGAEIFVVICNTAHSPEIFKIYNTDGVVSIIKATLGSVVKSNLSKVGFVGTNGSFKTKIYEESLKVSGIKVKKLSPSENEKYIHNSILFKRVWN